MGWGLTRGGMCKGGGGGIGGHKQWDDSAKAGIILFRQTLSHWDLCCWFIVNIGFIPLSSYFGLLASHCDSNHWHHPHHGCGSKPLCRNLVPCWRQEGLKYLIYTTTVVNEPLLLSPSLDYQHSTHQHIYSMNNIHQERKYIICPFCRFVNIYLPGSFSQNLSSLSICCFQDQPVTEGLQIDWSVDNNCLNVTFVRFCAGTIGAASQHNTTEVRDGSWHTNVYLCGCAFVFVGRAIVFAQGERRCDTIGDVVWPRGWPREGVEFEDFVLLCTR